MSAEVTLGWNNARLAAGARQASAIVDSTTSKMRSAFASIAAAGVGFIGVREIVDATVKYDSLRLGMVSLTGSVEDATDRMSELRTLAKDPGLGFAQVVETDIRLRSAGISASVSERAIREFGNALAVVGKGKEELDGVALALSQIASKGKVSAEEINQIAERVPQIRTVMKDVFGTADTEKLQKMGITSEEFIDRVVKGLEKIPRAIVGLQGKWDNLTDSMTSRLADIGTGIAQGILGPMENTTEALENSRIQAEGFGQSVGSLIGIIFDLGKGFGFVVDEVGQFAAVAANLAGDTLAKYIPALSDWKQEVKEFNEAELLSADAVRKLAEEERICVAIQKALAASEDALTKAANDRAEAEIKATRAIIEKNKAAEDSFRTQLQKTEDSRLTDEEKLEKVKAKILQIDRELNAVSGQVGGTEIAFKLNEERLKTMDELDRLSKSIQKTNEESNKTEAEKQAKMAEEVAAKEQAMQLFALELAIAEAASRGQDAKVAKLERERDIIEQTTRLMNELGIGYDEAAKMAERLVNAETKAEARKNGGDGERSKIRGYSQDQGDAAAARTRAGTRVDEARANATAATTRGFSSFAEIDAAQKTKFGNAFGNAPAEQAAVKTESPLTQVMDRLDKWANSTSETIEKAFQ
jgi:tape measure domain-containing protein